MANIPFLNQPGNQRVGMSPYMSIDIARPNISSDFKAQVLNCVNTIICHRLNDQESAEDIAAWIGTKDGFDISAQLDSRLGISASMGSVKVNKQYIIHPESIKQNLKKGECYAASKINNSTEKMKVKY